MKSVIRTLAFGFVILLLGKVIVSKKASSARFQKVMTDVVPKVMDRALFKLHPEQRSELLAHYREVLSKLEQKYGESPASPLDGGL